jgi:uncharacterized protein
MSRLLFIIVIVALIYWLLSSKRRNPPRNEEPRGAQDMVKCSYCGVHLPKNESILKGGKFYCCIAHSEGKQE